MARTGHWQEQVMGKTTARSIKRTSVAAKNLRRRQYSEHKNTALAQQFDSCKSPESGSNTNEFVKFYACSRRSVNHTGFT
jgi:hypothetical protein